MNQKRLIKKIWNNYPAFSVSSSELLDSAECAQLCFDCIQGLEQYPDWPREGQFSKVLATKQIITKDINSALRSDSVFVKTFAYLIVKDKYVQRHTRKHRRKNSKTA